MTTDYEVKAHKADDEVNGAEYVRNGPPGPVLTLIGLVIGALGELSRSVKRFVSDCAEKGSISPAERFGGGSGPRYDRQLHQPRVWPGLLAKRDSGPTRGSHSCTGSKQYPDSHSTSTGNRGAENAWDSTGDWAQGGFTSPA